MKIFRTLFYSLLLMLALLAIVPVFVPDTIQVTDTILIHAPAKEPYIRVANFTNWTAWEPLKRIDRHELAVTVENVMEVGSIRTWSSPLAGTGSSVVQELRANEYVRLQNSYTQPRIPDVLEEWTFVQTDSLTIVTCTQKSTLSYPFRRYLYFVRNTWLKDDITYALQLLKQASE